MGCAFCGGGDRWIKTCRTPAGGTVRVCDPCWEAVRLVVVPGPVAVAARCDECWHWFTPREMAELRPGGRWSAYYGVCGGCARG